MSVRFAAFPLVVAAAFALGACGSGGSSTGKPAPPAGPLQSGIDRFLGNHIAESIPLLEQAANQDPGNANAHAWLAEALRRTGKDDEAFAEVQRAVAIDSCNAFAQSILGELYSPLHSGAGSSRASYDEAWAHYLKAADCDPGECNVLIPLWVEAYRRGDTVRQNMALARMHDRRFFSAAAMAFARWLLSGLPQNAVLLTNGDMDTFPPLVLQAEEGVRPDVVIVNTSLLNLDWYWRDLGQSYGLPVPNRPPFPFHTPDGRVILPAQQIMSHWLSRYDQFRRPLTAAVTVGDLAFAEGHLQLAGGFYRFVLQSGFSPVDVASVQKSLRDLRPAEFDGPTAGPDDRSPVRRTPGLIDNIPTAALRAARQALADHDTATALDLASWTDRFVNDAARGLAAPGHFRAEIDSVRAEAATVK